MRRVWLLAMAMAVACSAPSPPPAQVYVSIDADAIGTALTVSRHVGAHAQLVASAGGVAVLAFDAEDLEALTAAMHREHHRCGGFMVHDSLEDARASLVARPERPPLDYTLDRAAIVAAVLPVLDRERILETIRELSAMPNRYYRSASGASASEWLRDRWRSFTTRSDVTVELFDHGYPQKSVILTIPGTTRADEVVVLGGHLDSINLRSRNGSASRAPGADDDASGIATLTEVARALLATSFRPERTIKIIAYAAEEVGLRGSLSIVKELVRRKVDVVGALQLDMTNYQGSDKDIWLIADYTSPAQNAFLGRLIDAYVGASWGYDRCGYACSDHASWHRAGVPASMPFEARFRDSNHHIHTEKDTLETSGDNADHAIKFARLAAAYAIELAKGDLANGEQGFASEEARAARERAGARAPWLLLVLAAVGIAIARRAGRASA